MKKAYGTQWKQNNIHIMGIPEEKETEGMLKAKKYIFFKKLHVKHTYTQKKTSQNWGKS